MTSIVPYARRLKGEIQTSLAAAELVDVGVVNEICASVGHRERSRFWSPTVTILTFLRQVLHSNCSCREAVANTLALSAESGSMQGDPSAYSQARQKLPRAVFEELNRHTVETVRRVAAQGRHWCNRTVVVVDGLSASMPDQPDLQRAWPQPCGQKPGCGFPVMRLVAIFCWASGCLLEWAAGSLHVSEITLVRRLYEKLKAGTVVLGDRHFGNYYDLALLLRLGLDGVFRLHQRRPTDLRSGVRLGPRDHYITWTKPKIQPRNVSEQEWTLVPESLTIRHVQVAIEIAGFRSRTLDLVTTLMDPVAYSAEKLAELYRDRWMVELNIRTLKTTMKMEVLKGQSRDMVLKELQVYQLAYNLIRLLMWRAAEACGADPRRLSFAGTQQRINAFLPRLAACRTLAEYRGVTIALLEQIAADVLPHRPNRIEPRAVKRRPKNYRRLTKPRAESRRMKYFING